MLPIMIGALVGMLEGMPVLYFLYAGFPLALIVSSLWTVVQVRRQLVEIHISSEGVAVRSLIGASHPNEELSWYRLLDIDIRHRKTHITVGHDPFTIEHKDWPEYKLLERNLVELASQGPKNLNT